MYFRLSTVNENHNFAKGFVNFQGIYFKPARVQYWYARCKLSHYQQLGASPSPSSVVYRHDNMLDRARQVIITSWHFLWKKFTWRRERNFKMTNILILIFLLLDFITISTAFCPDKCICDDDNLETTCVETNLEVRVFKFDYLIICNFSRWCQWHWTQAWKHWFSNTTTFTLWM